MNFLFFNIDITIVKGVNKLFFLLIKCFSIMILLFLIIATIIGKTRKISIECTFICIKFQAGKIKFDASLLPNEKCKNEHI